MADERRIVISSAEHGLSAEEIARRTFATAFRGFDAPEVRSFLKRVADAYASLETEVRELRQRLDEVGRAPSTSSASAPPAPVELDEEMLTNALGMETARVLRSAREAAVDIQAKAEQKVARLVREAEEEAARLRSDAETVLSRRVEEAEEVAAGIRRAAEADAEALRAKAKAGADTEIEAAKAQGRELVIEAQALREKVLGDLSRRRKLGLAQVEQLRAGRERLLDAYRLVRRTLDEVTEELSAAEAEARLAAEAAGRRVAAEAEVSVEELEAELAAGRDLVLEPAVETEPETEAVPEPAVPEAQGEAEAETDAGGEPEQEAEPAPVVALEERRSSTLRIIRRAKNGGREEPVELAVVEPSGDDEVVRVIRPETGAAPEPVKVDEPATTAAPEEPAPAEAVVAAAPDLAEAATEPDIDSLFARIKADRAAAVADAESVLTEGEGKAEAETDTPHEVEPEAVPEPAATSDDDESALQLRDKLLEPVDSGLVRRLKRALQDDQNDTLDRVRTAKGKPTVEVLLLDEADHAHRYRDVAVLLLAEAAKAGAAFAGRDDADAPGVGDQADELAREIVHPLRERLARGLEEAATSGDDDLFARLSSVYREWKLQRLEPAARHAVATVFARNAFALVPDGTMLRWVVDDEGGPCPDCDDDALAGPTAKGEAFPTGQLHPPAHPGCRCVLVAASG